MCFCWTLWALLWGEWTKWQSIPSARTMELLGDDGFVGTDDWGLVVRSWDDQELFGYVCGGGATAAAFGTAVGGVAMRRGWAHRQASGRVK